MHAHFHISKYRKPSNYRINWQNVLKIQRNLFLNPRDLGHLSTCLMWSSFTIHQIFGELFDRSTSALRFLSSKENAESTRLQGAYIIVRRTGSFLKGNKQGSHTPGNWSRCATAGIEALRTLGVKRSEEDSGKEVPLICCLTKAEQEPA